MCREMKMNQEISVVNGNLLVHSKTTLTGVPGNITLAPTASVDLPTGAFLGAVSQESKSHHVFPIGKLENLRFICCFRFKLWWMTQKMGTFGKDIPIETQFMLLENKEASCLSEGTDIDTQDETVYIVFLPLLEGLFRASLQGNAKNEVELCLESGDPAVQTSESRYSVFIGAGTDPFKVLTGAVKSVEKHLRTFVHRERKKLPGILDYFGWCTWDAFYTDVTAEGVQEGLESLAEGGAPPRFLIIDDGWQSVAREENMWTTVAAGTQYGAMSQSSYKYQATKHLRNCSKNKLHLCTELVIHI
eukprot:c24785_g2_i1 orf=177-1085(+)